MTEVLLVVLGAVLAKLSEIGLDSFRRYRIARVTPSLARLDDVLHWGWDGPELLRNLIAFDRRIVGEVLTDEREGTVQQWAPLFTLYPESWILLTMGPKRIIGYWHFAALSDEYFQRAKTGDLLDSEITVASVQPIDVPGVYNLYFVLIAVNTECPGAGAKLIDAFFDQLEALAARGIIFREICTNAMTKDGKRLCEGFGMTPLGPNKDFGTVYSLPLHPWPPRLTFKRWLSLAEQYKRILEAEL